MHDQSLSVSGEHHVTCHNMGMSYFYLGKLKQAKECFERSLKLDEASIFCCCEHCSTVMIKRASYLPGFPSLMEYLPSN